MFSSHSMRGIEFFRRTVLVSLVILMTCAGAAFGSAGAVNPLAVEGPVAGQFAVQPLAGVRVVNAVPIDAAALAAEEAGLDLEGMPPRFALSETVNINPDSDGTWEVLDSRFDMWRLRISSPGVLSLNLGFTSYRLPKGARLTIHPADVQGADDPRGVRTFTGSDNQDHGALWTPVVLGSDIVLELVIPRESRHDYDLSLTSINKGYRFFGEDSQAQADKSGSCNIDVICPEGDDWRREINSIGVFTIGGVWKCTGFMVNNTAEDARALFMTANHCGLSTSSSASLVVYWNFQSPTCGQQGGGSLAQFMTGATFLSASATSDFALVEMSQPIDPTYGISFVGWDWSGDDVDAAVCIHHPRTDEKSISFEDDPTTITSYLSNAVPGDKSHIRVTDWDLGTTEGGSSGSPLFDLNHRVVGQLHGGYAACGNNDSDWYGRFSVSWPEISQYLDPAGTGAVTLDAYAPFEATMVVSPAQDAAFEGPQGGPFTPLTVDYEISNNSDVPLTYDASADVAWIDLAPATGLVPAGGTQVLSVTTNSSAASLAQGQYSGILTILNLTDGQGDTTRDLEITAGVPVLIHSFYLDEDPGWSTAGDWAFGEPSGGGGAYGNPDPTAGSSGNHVYGYNLDGDYPSNLPQTHLVTKDIDCTGLEGVVLRFHRWLNVEQPDYDQASLAVSIDGTNFTTIWTNTGEITDLDWTQVEYNIGAIADGQKTVYIRWTMGATDGSWNFSGWNIDDVEIWGLQEDVSAVGVPSEYRLSVGNHPNPFNPSTTVNFVLEKDGPASVKVYDLKGRLVRVLADESLAAGPQSVSWNGMNDAGQRTGSGIYLVRVVAGNQSAEHKMILLK